MILNTAIETMPPSEKKILQNQKLQKVIERTYEKTLFYQKKFHAAGLSPADISTVHDLHQLPCTTAADLSNHYPFGFLTMPVSGVARFEQTSGALAASGFTSQDLIWQQELIARSLVSCYITTTSVLLHLPESISSVSARSLQQSAEMLGVTVISAETDDPNCQLRTILDFGITTLFAAPSKLLAFAGFLRAQGLTNRDLPLMNLLCETQYCSTVQLNELKEMFQLPIYTLYGFPQLMSLGIAGECYQQQGLHIHDDHFYPEIINPHTDAILSDHQYGELVLTTLSREAAPLLRYRTGSIALITHEPCACGRTSPRVTFLP